MSLLSNAIKANVGNTDSTIYTTPVGKNGILIGGNIANTIAKVINVDIKIKRGADSYFILKGVPIPPGASFSFSGLEQKVVLSPADAIVIKSSDLNSADVWLSMSEMAIAPNALSTGTLKLVG